MSAIGTTHTEPRNFFCCNSEYILMFHFGRGLFGLVAATICTGFCITIVTGEFSHWLALAAGIGMGLWAVRIMARS
jgi:hypothetical protein